MISPRKTIALLAITCLFSFNLTGCSDKASVEEVQQIVAEHEARAYTYISDGWFRSAGIEGRNIIQKHPRSVVGYEVLSELYNEIGDHRSAIETVRSMPVDVKKTAKLKISQANAFVSLGKTKSARTLVDQIEGSDLQKYAAEVTLVKARLNSLEGNAALAEQIYRDAVIKFPENSDVILDAAEFALFQKNIDVASGLLNDAELLESNKARRLYLLALLELEQEQFTSAELHLTEALELRQKEDRVTSARVAILTKLESLMERTNRGIEAIAYREQLEAFYGKPNIDLREKMSSVYKLGNEQNSAAARVELEAIIGQYPQYRKAHLMLAALDFQDNQMDTAALRFIEHIDLEADNAQLIEMAVRSNIAENNVDQMLLIFEGSLAVEQDPYLLNARARLQAQKGLFSEAVASVKAAIEKNPEGIQHQSLLASIYVQQDLKEKAIEVMEAALTIDVGNEDTEAIEQRSSLSRKYVSELLQSSSETDLNKAQNFVDQLLSKEADRPATQTIAAGFYALKGDFVTAKKYAQQSLAKNPGSMSGVLGLVTVMRKLNDPYSAILDVFSEAVELSPNNPNIYVSVLRSASNENELNEAAKYIEAKAEQFQSSVAYRVLATASIRRDDSKAAEKYYELARRYSKDSSSAESIDSALTIARSKVSVEAGDVARAREILQDGLREYGDSIPLLRELFSLEVQNGNFASAKELLPRLSELDPDLAMFFDANLDYSQGENDSALGKYRNVWSNIKTDAVAQRIYSISKTVQNGKAAAFLEEWGNAIPDSIPQKQLASSIAIQNRDYYLATNITEALIQQMPENPSILNNLAWLYQQIGNPEALKIAEKAYTLSPDRPDIVDTYGWVLMKNNRAKEAVPLLEKALAMDPDNKDIAVNLEAAKAQLN